MCRHMTNEAVLVYKQAVQLYPADAQASFRLAELYMVAGRLGDAVAVLEEFKGHLHEPNPAIAQVDAQIRDLKRQAAEKQSR